MLLIYGQCLNPWKLSVPARKVIKNNEKIHVLKEIDNLTEYPKRGTWKADRLRCILGLLGKQYDGEVLEGEEKEE